MKSLIDDRAMRSNQLVNDRTSILTNRILQPIELSQIDRILISIESNHSKPTIDRV
jgi:hypothetical protein